MHFRKIILLLLSTFFAGFALAQDVRVDLQILEQAQGAQIFIVGDLDPTGLGNAPNFFQVRLQNNEPTENVEMQILFELQVGGNTIVDAISNDFVLPASTLEVLSNSALSNGSAVIQSTGEFVEWDVYNVDYDRVENLKNRIMSSGRLPNDQYVFMISWRRVENNVPVGGWIPDPYLGDNILTISNPTTIEAIYPGSRVAEDNLQEVMTTFPYILYQSDASEFNIAVYEKYGSDESIQDVLSHDPVLDVRGYPNLLFQYPTDPSPLMFDQDPLNDGFGGSVGSVRPLEHGKIYYYFVQAVVQSSGGQELINSDVYQFKVTGIEPETASSSMMTIYLQQLLGGQYAHILSQLEAYSYTGKMYLNGTPIQMEELSRIINLALQNKIDIKNVYIE